jgi:hypothetical protein
MFRFSMDKNAPFDTNVDQQVTAGITKDDDYGRRLQETGEYREDEIYYRAENMNPKSVKDAVEYVQGIFFRVPSRIWIGGEAHEVTESIAASTRKPVT